MRVDCENCELLGIMDSANIMFLILFELHRSFVIYKPDKFVLGGGRIMA